ncbi:hypothetical protein VNO77_16750 [Canavalia gladiata]|uniref:KANL2-like probable zinc-finger domain-containing protein n=1 Tax=Canavalia gladiata TaxID=3824 RepID=A0AAN9QIQ4_CANGL
MEESPKHPSSSMTIDGAEIDRVLANSAVLTRREVIERRLRRVRQLARCYRVHYWALMEELKSKYRDYYWTYGRSPFKEDEHRPDGTVVSGDNANGTENPAFGDDVVRCAFGGCKSKAMALTRFCHAHILSDSKQRLYRGCSTVAKNLPTGPSFCNKPVLRSMVPRACPTHYQLGEKCLLRAIKRAGYNISTNRKPSPKLHVVVSEFVRQIQNKRKIALKTTVPKHELKKQDYGNKSCVQMLLISGSYVVKRIPESHGIQFAVGANLFEEGNLLKLTVLSTFFLQQCFMISLVSAQVIKPNSFLRSISRVFPCCGCYCLPMVVDYFVAVAAAFSLCMRNPEIPLFFVTVSFHFLGFLGAINPQFLRASSVRLLLHYEALFGPVGIPLNVGQPAAKDERRLFATLDAESIRVRCKETSF